MELKEHTCAWEGCGVTFGLTDGFEDRRKEDHKSFYCPNGHSMSYRGETDSARADREHARAELKAAEAQRARKEADRLRRELKQAKAAGKK